MKFSLRQLEVFLATAHYQSISEAARSLHMSQSAASESLKSLEDTYDIQLFDRVGKRLRLNSLGVKIQQHAENLIAQARSLENSLRTQDETGELKIGATLSIGNYLAINILADFKQIWPGVTTHLEVDNTAHIVSKILNYELDIGLIEGEIAHPDLEVTAWRDDELMVFCGPSHPFAKLETLTDDHLKQAKWILREFGSGTRQAFDYAMHGILSELHIDMELQHTEAIKRAVERGTGLGCLSRITLDDAFRRQALIPLPVPHRDFKRRFYFILRKGRYHPPFIARWQMLCQNY